MRLNSRQRATARSNTNSLNNARGGSRGAEDTENNNNNNNTKRVLVVGEGRGGGESSKHSAESSFLFFLQPLFGCLVSVADPTVGLLVADSGRILILTPSTYKPGIRC